MTKAHKKRRNKVAVASKRVARRPVGTKGPSRPGDEPGAIEPGARVRLAAKVPGRGALHPFILHYPEIGSTETRIARVGEGHPNLPAGKYAFTEYFCIDPECDCRRVRINVVKLDGYEIMATIGYGWASDDHYRRWMEGSPSFVNPKGIFLEPLADQTSSAPACMALFERMLKDELYQARIRRHYRLMKEPLS